ncbi:hypothetical protein VP01_909g1 [Puccinia sorghi]|uniref:Uncharacterized protein n=1 Tax=Puccinia sorghi TaxID=27349 RepID=A0A0L6U7L6_9BASI|nr:hypothetical protein VP01_909g1 [Puccinia sorghi]
MNHCELENKFVWLTTRLADPFLCFAHCSNLKSWCWWLEMQYAWVLKIGDIDMGTKIVNAQYVLNLPAKCLQICRNLARRLENLGYPEPNHQAKNKFKIKAMCAHCLHFGSGERGPFLLNKEICPCFLVSHSPHRESHERFSVPITRPKVKAICTNCLCRFKGAPLYLNPVIFWVCPPVITSQPNSPGMFLPLDIPSHHQSLSSLNTPVVTSTSLECLKLIYQYSLSVSAGRIQCKIWISLPLIYPQTVNYPDKLVKIIPKTTCESLITQIIKNMFPQSTIKAVSCNFSSINHQSSFLRLLTGKCTKVWRLEMIPQLGKPLASPIGGYKIITKPQTHWDYLNFNCFLFFTPIKFNTHLCFLIKLQAFWGFISPIEKLIFVLFLSIARVLAVFSQYQSSFRHKQNLLRKMSRAWFIFLDCHLLDGHFLWNQSSLNWGFDTQPTLDSQPNRVATLVRVGCGTNFCGSQQQLPLTAWCMGKAEAGQSKQRKQKKNRAYVGDRGKVQAKNGGFGWGLEWALCYDLVAPSGCQGFPQLGYHLQPLHLCTLPNKGYFGGRCRGKPDLLSSQGIPILGEELWVCGREICIYLFIYPTRREKKKKSMGVFFKGVKSQASDHSRKNIHSIFPCCSVERAVKGSGFYQSQVLNTYQRRTLSKPTGLVFSFHTRIIKLNLFTYFFTNHNYVKIPNKRRNTRDVLMALACNQVELRMDFVTSVDVKLNNPPDVLFKSSCYHPSNINKSYLHFNLLNKSYISFGHTMFLQIIFQKTVKDHKEDEVIHAQGLMFFLNYHNSYQLWLPFYDLDILFLCYDHIENKLNKTNITLPNIYKSLVRRLKIIPQLGKPLAIPEGGVTRS